MRFRIFILLVIMTLWSSTTDVEASWWDPITTWQSSCSKTGFFVNPHDCSKFYRCVKFQFEELLPEPQPSSGWGSSDLPPSGPQTLLYRSKRAPSKKIWPTIKRRILVRFDFDCPCGTVFDESVNVCVHPGPGGCAGGSSVVPGGWTSHPNPTLPPRGSCIPGHKGWSPPLTKGGWVPLPPLPVIPQSLGGWVPPVTLPVSSPIKGGWVHNAPLPVPIKGGWVHNSPVPVPIKGGWVPPVALPVNSPIKGGWVHNAPLPVPIKGGWVHNAPVPVPIKGGWVPPVPLPVSSPIKGGWVHNAPLPVPIKGGWVPPVGLPVNSPIKGGWIHNAPLPIPIKGGWVPPVALPVASPIKGGWVHNAPLPVPNKGSWVHQVPRPVNLPIKGEWSPNSQLSVITHSNLRGSWGQPVPLPVRPLAKGGWVPPFPLTVNPYSKGGWAQPAPPAVILPNSGWVSPIKGPQPWTSPYNKGSRVPQPPPVFLHSKSGWAPQPSPPQPVLISPKIGWGPQIIQPELPPLQFPGPMLTRKVLPKKRPVNPSINRWNPETEVKPRTKPTNNRILQRSGRPSQRSGARQVQGGVYLTRESSRVSTQDSPLDNSFEIIYENRSSGSSEEF